MNLMRAIIAIAFAVFLANGFLFGAAQAERTDEPTASVSATKADRISTAFDVFTEACSTEAWPNIPAHCLSRSADAPVKAPVRTVTVVRNDEASATSTVTRLPVLELAAR